MNKDQPQNLDQENKQGSPKHIPFLLEFTLTVSRLVVILVGVLTALISVIAGAEIWVVALRTGAAILSLGFLTWSVNWLLSHNTLEAVRVQMTQTRQGAPPKSTVEKEA